MFSPAPRVSTSHLSYKTYCTIANMQSITNQDASRRFHFSALVKANRAGGNMFDQGKRHDPKFDGFTLPIREADAQEISQVVDGDGHRIDVRRGYAADMLDRGVTFVQVNEDGTTTLLTDESML